MNTHCYNIYNLFFYYSNNRAVTLENNKFYWVNVRSDQTFCYSYHAKINAYLNELKSEKK